MSINFCSFACILCGTDRLRVFSGFQLSYRSTDMTEMRNWVTGSMYTTFLNSMGTGPDFAWRTVEMVTSSFEMYVHPSGRRRFSGGTFNIDVIRW